MKKVVIICFAMAGILSLSALKVRSATFCKQEFGLLAASRDMVLISEDISGECMGSALLSVHFRGEGPTLGRLELKEYKNWGDFRDSLAVFHTAKIVEMSEKNGAFSVPKGKMTLRAPAADAKLMAEFEKHIQAGGSGARTWNESSAKYSLPAVTGAKAFLDYYYPNGLYINYTLDRAYYLPQSGRLLIFTRQEKTAVGMDSMHGFMILRIEE